MQAAVSFLYPAVLVLLSTLADAYEIAFFPYFLGLFYGADPTPPILWSVYPRFSCNAVSFEGYPPNNRYTQNILVRTAADGIGPPKAIMFYESDPGHPDPCGADKQELLGVFYPDKPSQQILPTESRGSITHWRELDEKSPEWELVKRDELLPGDVLRWNWNDHIWDLEPETIRNEVFDADQAYHTVDESDRSNPDTGAFLDNSQSDSTSPGLSTGGGNVHANFNPLWTPQQEVPDADVHAPSYRDYRNWRMREAGEYRPIPRSFLAKYTYDQLRRMGYVVDAEMEARLNAELDMEQARRKDAENFYENLRMSQFPGGDQFLEDLIWGWSPAGNEQPGDTLDSQLATEVGTLDNDMAPVQGQPAEYDADRSEVNTEYTTGFSPEPRSS
ncbi:hypothetical protein TWF696_006998 [Orbilia brochopaga]|uniref:Uncharacterized protein n=1 Tax=Orbilia brochopaga TaxID=3140254 RepID=A0AAV9UTV4_9PEZI